MHQISFFSLKMGENFQTWQGCKNAFNYHKETCDTAFESLSVILFNRVNSGYYSGTHGTQKYTYVKHVKLNRLERGHFELSTIRQQVLNKTNIIKKSAFWSSFRNHLTSG